MQLKEFSPNDEPEKILSTDATVHSERAYLNDDVSTRAGDDVSTGDDFSDLGFNCDLGADDPFVVPEEDGAAPLGVLVQPKRAQRDANVQNLWTARQAVQSICVCSLSQCGRHGVPPRSQDGWGTCVGAE